MLRASVWYSKNRCTAIPLGVFRVISVFNAISVFLPTECLPTTSKKLHLSALIKLLFLFVFQCLCCIHCFCFSALVLHVHQLHWIKDHWFCLSSQCSCSVFTECWYLCSVFTDCTDNCFCVSFSAYALFTNCTENESWKYVCKENKTIFMLF